MSCAAYRSNDQMQCGPCALAWDIDDPEPPSCGLECVGAAAGPATEPTLSSPGRIFSTPGYDQIDADFDDIPHTLLRDL